MIKQINRERNQHRKAAIVVCLFFCVLLALLIVACQPGKAPVVLTPIPVEQTPADIEVSEQQETSPDPVAELFADMHWKNEVDLYGGLSQAPFVYPLSEKHITQEPEILAGNVRILVNADVVIPQAAGYGIRQCDRFGFTTENYKKMLGYLLPNATWIPSGDTAAVLADGTLDLTEADLSEGVQLTVETGDPNHPFTVYAADHQFSFFREDAIVYREGFLVGDVEMEQEFGEIIREPISLTLQEAKAKAESLLAQSGIQGWALDSAERACMFNANDTDSVLSRGWDFVYMLNNSGLMVHYYGGSTGGKNDQLDYCGSDAGYLWIYVDESGISRINWVNRYRPRVPEYTNVEIIGVEDALRLAKERLTRLYGDLETDTKYDIEIYAIRLSSMLLAYSDEQVWGVFDNKQRDMVHMVPTWDISCREIFSTGEGTYFTIPFCATDGGAITMRN